MGNKELDKKWNDLFEKGNGSFSLENMVVCDDCNEDYTNSKVSGGFIFGSRGVCPVCAPKWMETIKKYNEEYGIKAKCREEESFADFVRRYRGPDAKVSITSFIR